MPVKHQHPLGGEADLRVAEGRSARRRAAASIAITIRAKTKRACCAGGHRRRLLVGECGRFAALDKTPQILSLPGEICGVRTGIGNEPKRLRASPKPVGEPAMNDAGSPITVQVHAAIAEIPAAAWDACAGDVNPSVCYAFLSALEDSGSTTARTGWAPQHLSLAGRGRARSSASCRSSRRAIPTANTSSTTAGPTPMSAPAGAITRS